MIIIVISILFIELFFLLCKDINYGVSDQYLFYKHDLHIKFYGFTIHILWDRLPRANQHIFFHRYWITISIDSVISHRLWFSFDSNRTLTNISKKLHSIKFGGTK